MRFMAANDFRIMELTQAEIKCGDLYETYNEFLDRLGIPDGDTRRIEADRRDGYTGAHHGY